MHSPANEPAAYSIQDTCRKLSIGKTFCYRLVTEGKLQRVKLGRRSLITAASIKGLLSGSTE